jgi:hypothetical protein
MVCLLATLWRSDVGVTHPPKQEGTDRSVTELKLSDHET